MILAGDIGGTKVNLALLGEESGKLKPAEEARFESRRYTGLEGILEEYFHGTGREFEMACFGIAGPVKDGICRVTNLPWSVEAETLKKKLGLDSIWLINDLAAMACSVPFLDASELSVLQAGNAAEEGRIAVVAAGTGMGQAFLIPDGRGRYVVLDSEGGHCDFAPRHKLEADLLQFLLGSLERVSVERVLSGAGLFGIYRFVKEHFSLEEPEWLVRELEENDPGAVVTRNGMEKKSPACEKALDLFVSLYGAVAGNLALQFLSSWVSASRSGSPTSTSPTSTAVSGTTARFQDVT